MYYQTHCIAIANVITITLLCLYLKHVGFNTPIVIPPPPAGADTAETKSNALPVNVVLSYPTGMMVHSSTLNQG